MKTPREILLKRHQAAAPKLDAIRREIVDAEFNVGQASSLSPSEKIRRPETGRMPVLLLIWRELIFPCRRIWIGLAAAWIVILTVNFSMHDHSPTVAMKSAPTVEMIMAWRQQERLLSELIGPNETRAAEPPKPFAPQPRSEQHFGAVAV